MAELRVKETGTIKLFESDNTSRVTIASPASLGADRTITLPDASVTLASGTMLATDGSGASLTALNASELGSGTVPTARLGSGSASSSTFLAGDNTWAAPGGGGMTLIELQTADTSATPVVDDLLFDGVFTSTYKDYLITGTVGMETSAVDLYFNFSNSTSVRTDTNQLSLVMAESLASGHSIADASFGQFSVGYLWLADNSSNAAGAGPVFNIWCIDPLKTSKGLPFYTGTIQYFTPESTCITGTLGGHYANGIAIDGFNISPSADGMNRYKIAVFGLHTS